MALPPELVGSRSAAARPWGSRQPAPPFRPNIGWRAGADSPGLHGRTGSGVVTQTCPRSCNPGYNPCPFSRRTPMPLRRFIIEREIPEVGTFERDQLRAAAAKSNEVLHQLGPDIQWVESYVADNKTFCVYLAKDEAMIRKHAEI